jgi:hypothetical protein
MNRIEFDELTYTSYLDSLPGEQAQALEQYVEECRCSGRHEELLQRGLPFVTATHTNAQGRAWQYWPLSAADQMWRFVTCNQHNCRRPALFVGVVDILGDGTLWYDSASAWCYSCMPREAMTPEAERLARHAEWARQQTINECLAAIGEFLRWNDFDQETDDVLTRLMSELPSYMATREQVLSQGILTAEYIDGRVHEPGMKYVVRPDALEMPDATTALSLNCSMPANE